MEPQNISVQMNVASFAYGLPGVKDREAYLQALRGEIESVAEYADQFAVEAVCVAGDNPLQYQGTRLGDLLRILRSTLPFRPRAEITVKAYPGTVTYFDLRTLSEFGVTRLSFDMRTFVQSELEALGRTYATSAIEVFMRMVQRKMVFFNFDVTLHYGMPGQTVESFRTSVEQGIRSMSTHLTLLPDAAAERAELPSFYREALKLIGDTNFEQYTPHHFARPDCASRWNRLTYSNQPRLGLGVGAVSTIEGARSTNTAEVAAYLDAAGHPEGTIVDVRPVTDSEIEANHVRDELYNLRPCDLGAVSPELRRRADALCQPGLLAIDDNRATLTQTGMADWGAVSAALGL